MSSLPHFALIFLGLLFCVGDVAALGLLITWQERAPSHHLRRARLWRAVLPVAVGLLALLLTVLTQLMLLWSQSEAK